MPTSSDSDDDAQMRQFLEAADTTLLTNSMFQSPTEKVQRHNKENIEKLTQFLDAPKSQRFLTMEDDVNNADLNLPEAVKKHIYKKLTELIKLRVEFCDVTDSLVTKRKDPKSRVKLLEGLDCYVNPYEEFEYESKGPVKKPIIKKRKIENNGEDELHEADRCKLVAVTAEDIMLGDDVKKWKRRPERKDKVFHYAKGFTGTLHGREITNEFTQLRRKNKWAESKIKQKIKK